MGLLSFFYPLEDALPRPPVPEGKTRICVSGFSFSFHTGRARAIADLIAEAHPDEYETWFYFNTEAYKKGTFLDDIKKEIKDSGTDVPEDHKTSPFCWLEKTSGSAKEYTALGGRDDLCEWTKGKFDNSDSKDAEFLLLCEGIPPMNFKTIFFDRKTPGTAKTA